jgi:hypothetical protein
VFLYVTGRFSALLARTISDELPSGRRGGGGALVSLDSVNFRDAVEEVVRLEVSPVDVMQRGFEKCLEKAGLEVSFTVYCLGWGGEEGASL